MQRKDKLIISVVTIPIALLLLLFTTFYLLSTHTEYCPLSHRINDTAKCVVLDKSGDIILIQHADLDRAMAYLEMIHGTTSTFYKLPDGVMVLAPSGYTAKIVPSNLDVIVFNGQRVPLVKMF